MSFADSHEVGGEGNEAGSVGEGGDAGSASHEKGVDGLLLGLSLSVIVVAKSRVLGTLVGIGYSGYEHSHFTNAHLAAMWLAHYQL
jgi:hypothetical protein